MLRIKCLKVIIPIKHTQAPSIDGKTLRNGEYYSSYKTVKNVVCAIT